MEEEMADIELPRDIVGRDIATTGKESSIMSEIKLKPCPFCGSSDVKSCPEGEREDGKPWQAYYVHCNICACDGPIVQVYDLDTPAETGRDASIDLWNWRVK